MLISGSIRKPSYTRTLAETVEQGLAELGARTLHWDLGRSPLPIADPEFHHDPATHPDENVREFVADADRAAAFVFASPIYHNSFSGVLKNALDHLSIPQFYYKPVGLISHGGHRSTQAVDQLRIVVRGLLGVAIPTNLCTAADDYRTSDSGAYELVSEDIRVRVSRFVAELVLFAQVLSTIARSC